MWCVAGRDLWWDGRLYWRFPLYVARFLVVCVAWRASGGKRTPCLRLYLSSRGVLCLLIREDERGRLQQGRRPIHQAATIRTRVCLGADAGKQSTSCIALRLCYHMPIGHCERRCFELRGSLSCQPSSPRAFGCLKKLSRASYTGSPGNSDTCSVLLSKS